jgi:hypothetical protein
MKKIVKKTKKIKEVQTENLIQELSIPVLNIVEEVVNDIPVLEIKKEVKEVKEVIAESPVFENNYEKEFSYVSKKKKQEAYIEL